MMMLKVIGLISLIVVVTGHPLETKVSCQSQFILCGVNFNDFLEEVCLGDTFSHCPAVDDALMPKFKNSLQAANECCKTGCNAGYLKLLFCKKVISVTPKTVTPENHNRVWTGLRKFLPPVWSEKIWGKGNAPDVWPIVSFGAQPQPIEAVDELIRNN